MKRVSDRVSGFFNKSRGPFWLTSGAVNSKITFACRNGGMADAHGSGPCEVKFMWVQVPFPALSGGF